MANDYYIAPAENVPITIIESDVRNNDAAAVEVGFDKLPSELDIKRSQYGNDTSSSGALYEVTIPNLDVPYYEGLELTFQATFENTSAANISVNGLTIVPVLDSSGVGVVAGNIKVDQVISMVYIESPLSGFQLISTAATAQDIEDAIEASEEAEASASEASTSASEASTSASEAAASAEIAAAKIMTAADFYALAEQRIRDNAGSGFSEWGKELTIPPAEPVNNGLWASPDISNSLFIGRVDSSASGISRTNSPLSNINGVHQIISSVNYIGGDIDNIISQPPALDGTKTYDNATGVTVIHPDSATAFASETSTNKVVISRQDFIFVEMWHEVVTDKDFVYPLGNVQYGAATYKGIALTNTAIAQGYSAFGAWDTTTTGYGVQWSTLSEGDKNAFVEDEDHNIFNDKSKVLQVRYRIRVVEGLGDTWEKSLAVDDWLAFDSMSYVKPQGKQITPQELADINSGTSGYFSTGVGTKNSLVKVVGEFVAIDTTDTINDPSVAEDGKCFAIPVALIERRNRGAYHPSYNPAGTANWNSSVGPDKWYLNSQTGTTTESCFNFWPIDEVHDVNDGTVSLSSGTLSSAIFGRADEKRSDSIQSSDVVRDDRMSSKRLPNKEVLKASKASAIASTLRGTEGVPSLYAIFIFSPSETVPSPTQEVRTVDTSFMSIGDELKLLPDPPSDPYTTTRVVSILSSTNFIVEGVFDELITYTGGSVGYFEVKNYHIQVNPTWTDLIGKGSTLLGPINGFEGTRINQEPFLGVQAFELSRKAESSQPVQVIRTEDDGSTWVEVLGLVIDIESNTITYQPPTDALDVILYRTKARFSEDAVNSEVLSLGNVYATQLEDTTQGGLLLSSLIHRVGTRIASPTSRDQFDTDLTSQAIDNSTGLLDNTSAFGSTEHITLPLSSPTNGGPTVKVLDYLSHDGNNQLTLNYVYKEMFWDLTLDDTSEFQSTAGTDAQNLYLNQLILITSGLLKGAYMNNVNFSASSWDTLEASNTLSKVAEGIRSNTGVLVAVEWDGNGFGDNNKFEIADNKNTLTDDNGNSVRYGMARVRLPYFYVEE